MSKDLSCPLCDEDSSIYYNSRKKIFYRCKNCGGVFLHPDMRLTPSDEKKRYNLHQNDASDAGYQAYLSPLTNLVVQNHPPNIRCLDFGCGPDSAVVKMLKKHGFNPKQYDPFFFDEAALLHQSWDVITCTEVMEHFYKPMVEFRRLRGMLTNTGKLYCMTRLLLPKVDFANWFYKNDASHVFFYSPESVEIIRKQAGFSKVLIDDRLIVFEV